MSKNRFSPDSLASISIINSQKLEVFSDLNSLNVSKQDSNAISDIILQVKQQGQVAKVQNTSLSSGISLMLSGDNRSGKLSAVAHIANKLNYKLYRIDLSHVVNKFIGETEKNLDRIFNANKGIDTILFFDEADALFGKRTKVADSHDRFANIEVSYLLQKMEQYRGLIILASNLKSSIDEVFVHKFKSVIHFPMPETKQRKNRWGKVFVSFLNLFKKKTFISVVEIDGSEFKRNVE